VIVLDTNVISEPLKPRADSVAQAWLDRQSKQELFLSAPVLMEIPLGVALLPDGRRKRVMAQATEELLVHFFEDRFLVFDRPAAAAYADLALRAKAKGYAISVVDCQIAAIAAVHGFTVATRDTAPFLAAGVAVVNPWVA
jgi:toxin FitB